VARFLLLSRSVHSFDPRPLTLLFALGLSTGCDVGDTTQYDFTEYGETGFDEEEDPGMRIGEVAPEGAEDGPGLGDADPGSDMPANGEDTEPELPQVPDGYCAQFPDSALCAEGADGTVPAQWCDKYPEDAICNWTETESEPETEPQTEPQTVPKAYCEAYPDSPLCQGDGTVPEGWCDKYPLDAMCTTP